VRNTCCLVNWSLPCTETVCSNHDQAVPIRCDADQLQQVFINLIMKALDAMTPGGGSLEVRTTIENGTMAVRQVRRHST
jgi:signal transduction histidine kinase